MSTGNERTPVLEFRGVDTHYGAAHILKNVSLEIYPGEMVCLLGGNASGKTTTLKTILGIVEPTRGEVLLDGQVVNGWTTAERVKAGVSMVPENRRLFKRMTVRENLEIGAYLREDKENFEADMEHIFELFVVQFGIFRGEAGLARGEHLVDGRLHLFYFRSLLVAFGGFALPQHRPKLDDGAIHGRAGRGLVALEFGHGRFVIGAEQPGQGRGHGQIGEGGGDDLGLPLGGAADLPPGEGEVIDQDGVAEEEAAIALGDDVAQTGEFFGLFAGQEHFGAGESVDEGVEGGTFLALGGLGPGGVLSIGAIGVNLGLRRHRMILSWDEEARRPEGRQASWTLARLRVKKIALRGKQKGGSGRAAFEGVQGVFTYTPKSYHGI